MQTHTHKCDSDNDGFNKITKTEVEERNKIKGKKKQQTKCLSRQWPQRSIHVQKILFLCLRLFLILPSEFLCTVEMNIPGVRILYRNINAANGHVINS